jgi:hypothetical protein
LANGSLLFDARNALDPEAMTDLGWQYIGVGRRGSSHGK